MRKMFALTVLAGFVVTAFLGARMFFFAVQPPGTPSSPQYVLIHKGETPTHLSQSLAKIGVVSDPEKFQLLGKFLGKWEKVKAGEYAVHPGLSPLDLFKILLSGQSVQHSVTVQEGENLYEIAQDFEQKKLIDRARFFELVQSKDFIRSMGINNPVPPNLEGYLFPDTYFFNRTQSPEEMIKMMVKKMQASWRPEWDARARVLGYTRHEILTLASMIEKETGAPMERPMIASVFHNRLKKRMRLQSDPTTIYGMWEAYQARGKNIRRSDLERSTPYNTYTVPALPAGPIGNPGIESMRAALFPAESEFLFFVSHNDGTHEFTRDYTQHLKAVQQFQLNVKAREGKSWRDLSKKKQ